MMDFEMESTGNTRNSSADALSGIDWQIDSEWVKLPPSSTPLSTGNPKKKSRSADFPSMTNISPRFHFTQSSKGERLLVIEKQALRLSKKTDSGISYWVCNILNCNARCFLDPSEKEIVRYAGEHNHDADVSRPEFKSFIHALKMAVKENPHVKPRDLYDSEFEKMKKMLRESGSKKTGSDLCLPGFEDVQTAMYNTRNAVLSSFSLRAAEEMDGDIASKPSAPTRSTRSKEGKIHGKRKSTPSKSPVALSSADIEELEGEWTNRSNKDASLSDIEDWLDEDSASSISPVLSSRKKQKAFSAHQMGELDMGAVENDENELWNETSPLEKIPRRKYRKRPASTSVFTCPHCPYKSNRHFNVQRHERLAHSTKKPEYSCKECGTSYSLEYRLKLHIKAVHQGEGHHCHICSRTFETMTGLKSHIVTKHKNEDPQIQREPPPELTCNLCGRVFTSKAHLLKHTSSHVMVQPFRCFTCNKPFLDECTWLTHQNNCNEEFIIQCCLCSAVIPSAQDLLTHMDIVHGRAEYSCQCGKMFPWKKSLLTHQQKCSLYLAEKTMN